MDREIEIGVRRRRQVKRIGVAVGVVVTTAALLIVASDWLRPWIKRSRARFGVVQRGNLEATLTEQVVGGFKSGVGEFFGGESFQGKDVKLRFRWTDVGEHGARWEQAYFDEARDAWETNWIMEFAEDR
jgi:hypothetical protein